MARGTNDEATLRLLNAIEEEEWVSQRSLSTRLGIAVGLTNAYVKRCLNKGWIKMSRAPARRYKYYLTPKGFAEKTRLTARYLSRSFQFFREARSQCDEAFAQCLRRGWSRVVLCGAGELAEIAVLTAREGPIEPMAIVAPDSAVAEFAGLPVLPDLAAAGPIDAVIVTDISEPQAVYEALTAHLDDERILTPPLLNLTRRELRRADQRPTRQATPQSDR